MSTPSKDPNEKGKKTSFWEKLSERKAAEENGSLVNAIVRQAEKEATGELKRSSPEPERMNEDDDKKIALARLGNAKTLLSFVIIAVIAVWVYFFAMLGESNYLHAKFGKENLTTELARKTELLQQIRTDGRDTKKFNKLLRVEALANRVLALDLENPILNYERPEGEKVIPHEGSTEVLLKTVNSNGEVIYLSEAELRNLESAQKARSESARKELTDIMAQSATFAETIKTDPEIENELGILIAEVAAINPQEAKFPSAVLRSHFAAAQSAASEILRRVKSANLANLVTDIKKQASAIDTTTADETTKKIVTELQTSLGNLSPQRPSSFETAINEIKALNITKISDNEIYQKVVQIVGDPRQEKNDSDLANAAVITRNLGRINTINELRADRIAWSSVIDRAEKIVRLGADLERDTDGTPTDARRDIDPDGKLVNLVAYAGKSKKGEIEIRGDAFGIENYSGRSFSLLADLIDALESSRYFKDVSGFAFSREENRQGGISSPLNFKLSLQNPAVADKRDIAATAPIKTTGPNDTKNTGIVQDLQKLEFSVENSATDNSAQTQQPQDTTTGSTSDTENVGIFDALQQTLNN
ncbi:MAG: hypothetical protein V1936_01355 [Patescibacteria group bacterium]